MTTNDAKDDFWAHMQERASAALLRAQEAEKSLDEARIRRHTAVRDMETHLTTRFNEVAQGAGGAQFKAAPYSVSIDPFDHTSRIEWQGAQPFRAIAITVNEQTGKIRWQWTINVQDTDGSILSRSVDQPIGNGEVDAEDAQADLIDRLIESLTDQDAFDEGRAPNIDL